MMRAPTRKKKMRKRKRHQGEVQGLLEAFLSLVAILWQLGSLKAS
jgi:hypothetical protein